MSDTDGKKPLGLRGGAPPGQVKQSFSHGRTKEVVVETKRKRVVVPKPGAGTSSPAPGSAGRSDPSRQQRGIYFSHVPLLGGGRKEALLPRKGST